MKTALDETRLLILGSQVLFDSSSEKVCSKAPSKRSPAPRNIWWAPRWR